MIAIRNTLLSGQCGPRTDSHLLAFGTTGSATKPFATPEIRADAAKEVLYRLVIEGTTGAPTVARLFVRFQVAQRITGGVIPGLPGAEPDPQTDNRPIWSEINANTHGGILPDGDWPTRVWRSEDGGPYIVERRILGGSSNRLWINPSNMTDGTNPGIVMSLEAEVRY